MTTVELLVLLAKLCGLAAGLILVVGLIWAIASPAYRRSLWRSARNVRRAPCAFCSASLMDVAPVRRAGRIFCSESHADQWEDHWAMR